MTESRFIINCLSQELDIPIQKVKTTISLLDEGASIPFIARYRKETTGSLSDQTLRKFSQRLTYLRNLEKLKNSIYRSIVAQSKMTPSLQRNIFTATQKSKLDELYRPFKQKRTTKLKCAFDSHLDQLAEKIIETPSQYPEDIAKEFLCMPLMMNNRKKLGALTIKEALSGAKLILINHLFEKSSLISSFLNDIRKHGKIHSTIKGKHNFSDSTYKNYSNFTQSILNIAPHRVLAIFRGARQKQLSVHICIDYDKSLDQSQMKLTVYEKRLLHSLKLGKKPRKNDLWIKQTVHEAWRTKIFPYLEKRLFDELKERAENQSIQIFTNNLKSLLLTAPIGEKIIMGLDPGIRTGIKIAVIDKVGEVLATEIIYPYFSEKNKVIALEKLKTLITQYHIELIAIGNGIGSEQAQQLIKQLIKQNTNLRIEYFIISEVGASVYSASVYASLELPNIDVSLRGAISIARRLQNPIAELIKINPKSIGIGQYQHDVSSKKLSLALTSTIEDCVNTVGVDLNTASPLLLSYVSGLTLSLAKNIVNHRNKFGRFQNRMQLYDVARINEKIFMQCAGFLRISQANNILDTTAIHPETYAITYQMLNDCNISLDKAIGNKTLLNRIDLKKFITPMYGLLTITDIIKQLENPYQSTTQFLRPTKLSHTISKIEDLYISMVLDGIITNITSFGIFVDIGVHHDALIHISAIGEEFISDLQSIFRICDSIRVKVTKIDLKNKKISLNIVH